MDMQWDAALAVLDHAYTNNKATIVASEKSAGNADKNIDKLILLLTKLSGKAYIDDGIEERNDYHGCQRRRRQNWKL